MGLTPALSCNAWATKPGRMMSGKAGRPCESFMCSKFMGIVVRIVGDAAHYMGDCAKTLENFTNALEQSMPGPLPGVPVFVTS